MRILEEEKEKKIQEIEKIIEVYVSDINKRKIIIDSFLDTGFINVIPPEEEEERFTQFITIDSQFSKNGSSRKPGNIVLNIKKLMKSIPDLISASYDLTNATSNRYLLIIRLGVAIWNALWQNLDMDIDKDSSIVLYVLWENCDNRHEIGDDLGYLKVNCIRKKLKMNELSKQEYADIINYLHKIRCIKIENGILKLIEGVKINY